jgi:hypothetical protein
VLFVFFMYPAIMSLVTAAMIYRDSNNQANIQVTLGHTNSRPCMQHQVTWYSIHPATMSLVTAAMI